MRNEGPWIYRVVGGPNDGQTVEMRDGRDFVRLWKPRKVSDLDLSAPVPEIVSLDEDTTLYTVRPIYNRLGYTGESILAPESMSNEKAVRLHTGE